MSEYESILRQLGSFGPYQRRAFILVSMFETPLAWAMLTPILLNAKPSWVCSDFSKLNLTRDEGNVTQQYMVNDWFGLETYNHMFNTSEDVPTTKDTCAKNSLDEDVVCPQIKFEDGFTSIISQWQLVCDADYVPELITSIQMVGVLIGAVLTGQMADLFGRRHILFIEHAVLVIMWFSSAFAGTWHVYAGMRFIIGALIGGVLVVNFVLPLELVTPEWRTFCGCIGLWAVGLMALALWGYLIRDWEYLVMATSTASVFILLAWWFVPESPRWLLSKGRIKKAERILTAMAKYNNRPVPDFSRLRIVVQHERAMNEVQRKYSYWHLCSSAKLAKNSAVLMYGWFVSSAVYYGLNFNTNNLRGNLYLYIFISGLVEIPALIFVVVVHNRLGRRLTVSLLMAIAGLFCFSILFIDITGNRENMSVVIVVLAMIGKAGIAGGWAALQVFSAEIFPTVVRNIGVGACSFSARIGGIIAPQIVFLGEKYLAVPFTVFGCMALLCGLLMWLLPETRGVPLQDELHVTTDQTIRVIIEEETRETAVEEAVPLQILDREKNNGLPNEMSDSRENVTHTQDSSENIPAAPDLEN